MKWKKNARYYTRHPGQRSLRPVAIICRSIQKFTKSIAKKTKKSTFAYHTRIVYQYNRHKTVTKCKAKNTFPAHHDTIFY